MTRHRSGAESTTAGHALPLNGFPFSGRLGLGSVTRIIISHVK
jgi:hypothetical protein